MKALLKSRFESGRVGEGEFTAYRLTELFRGCSTIDFRSLGGIWGPSHFGPFRGHSANRHQTSSDRFRLASDPAQSTHPPGIKGDSGYPQAAAYGYTASLSSRRLHVDNHFEMAAASTGGSPMPYFLELKKPP
jgi:hypothetical protein